MKEQRNFVLLRELEKGEDSTQRALSKRLGVALGLTNLYLKRLASKGYIKITSFPGNRIKYLLTPKGIAEKSRLTYLYAKQSFEFYHDMRQQLNHILNNLCCSGVQRVVVFGTGELAELAYISLQESELTLVGFVDRDPTEAKFLSCPLWSIDTLPKDNFDAVVIADLEHGQEIYADLRNKGIKNIFDMHQLA
jgi:DNA-binding MarR family transcriptional regulator